MLKFRYLFFVVIFMYQYIQIWKFFFGINMLKLGVFHLKEILHVIHPSINIIADVSMLYLQPFDRIKR